MQTIMSGHHLQITCLSVVGALIMIIQPFPRKSAPLQGKTYKTQKPVRIPYTLYFFAPSTHLSTLELEYHIMLPFISCLQQRLLFISAATACIFLVSLLAQQMPSCANNAHQSKPHRLEAFNDVKHAVFNGRKLQNTAGTSGAIHAAFLNPFFFFS